jgi:quercetin dioxygenase-like cupin family protein
MSQPTATTTSRLAASIHRSGSGPHHLMLGTVTVSRLLAGDDTAGELALVELRGLPDSGPGPHVDPWRESFYVLAGELTFQCEEDGEVRTLIAKAGDALSIPSGVPHAFRVSSREPARYLILGTPAGIAAFFADAGEAVREPVLPSAPPPFDRERLLLAFARHGLEPHAFHGAAASSGVAEAGAGEPVGR